VPTFAFLVPRVSEQPITVYRLAWADTRPCNATHELRVREHAEDSASNVAEVYGYLDDAGNAFEWLELASVRKMPSCSM